MFRGTTPTLYFHVTDDTDLNEIKEVWITLCNREISYNWKLTTDRVKIDVEKKMIYIELTQEETLAFQIGMAVAQVRVLMNDDKAYASINIPLHIGNILKDGAIAVEANPDPGPDPIPDPEPDPDPAP